MAKRNVTGLANAVRDELFSMPHIKTSLVNEVINYSALARKIMRPVSQKLGKQISEENIVLALKRCAQELMLSKPEGNYLEVLSESEITMQDNILFVKYSQTEELAQKMARLFAEGEWKIGELRIFIETGDQALLIMKKDRLESVFGSVWEHLADSAREHSLVSITLPDNSSECYGTIAELSSCLANSGISFELVTTPTELHFLVDEKSSEKTFHILKEILRQARAIHEKSGNIP